MLKDRSRSSSFIWPLDHSENLHKYERQWFFKVKTIKKTFPLSAFICSHLKINVKGWMASSRRLDKEKHHFVLYILSETMVGSFHPLARRRSLYKVHYHYASLCSMSTSSGALCGWYIECIFLKKILKSLSTTATFGATILTSVP